MTLNKRLECYVIVSKALGSREVDLVVLLIKELSHTANHLVFAIGKLHCQQK